METKTKKILGVIVGIVLVFMAGFGTSELIVRIRATRSTDRLERLLGTGYDKSMDVYSELEKRLTELDGLREQAGEVESGIDGCIDLAEQSGQALGLIGESVDELGATSTDIGTTIRKLRTNQQRIKQYVTELKEHNTELEEELRRLQGSVRKQ